jgi:hypothetical protein
MVVPVNLVVGTMLIIPVVPRGQSLVDQWCWPNSYITYNNITLSTKASESSNVIRL